MTATPRCHESFEVTSPRAGTNAESTTRFEQAMLLTKQTHWPPGFVDYLFIAFTQSSTFGPTGAPLPVRLSGLRRSSGLTGWRDGGSVERATRRA